MVFVDLWISKTSWKASTSCPQDAGICNMFVNMCGYYTCGCFWWILIRIPMVLNISWYFWIRLDIVWRFLVLFVFFGGIRCVLDVFWYFGIRQKQQHFFGYRGAWFWIRLECTYAYAAYAYATVIVPVRNPVPTIRHLPRRASWPCGGWLLDGHWILNR